MLPIELLICFAFSGCLGILAARWWLRRSRAEHLPAESPDPYVIAWVRGGPVEPIKLAVVELAQAGCIQLVSQSTLVIGEVDSAVLERTGRSADAALSPMAARILLILAFPLTPAKLLEEAASDEDIQRLVAPTRAWAEEAGLVADDEARREARQAAWTAALVAVGSGFALRHWFALNGSASVGWVAVAIAVALVPAAFLLLRVPRILPTGDAWLRSARFNKPRSETRSISHVGDPLLLSVAIIGTSALAGTPFADLGEALDPRPKSGSDGGASTSGGDSSTSKDHDGSGNDGGGDGGGGGGD